MNLDAIIADVQSVIRDSAGVGVTTTDITRWANRGQLDLASRLGLLDEQWTEADNAIASGAFALPWNLIEITRLRITDETADVQFVDDDVFQSFVDGGGTPDATLGRVFEETVELYPEPADGSEYVLRGKRKPALLIYGESAATKTITAASASAEVATFTFGAAHGYSIGDWIDVTGVTPSGYNGTWRIRSVPLTTTFTAHIGTTPGVGTVFGTAEKTDVPEIPEELHGRLVDYCRYEAKLKKAEYDEANIYLAKYEDGLPPSPTSRARTMPGPLTLYPAPGWFDEDVQAMHL